MMEQNILYNTNKDLTFYISLDYYRDKIPVGEMYNANSGIKDFYSTMDMLNLINCEISNLMNSNIRSFYENEEENTWENAEEISDFDLREFSGKIATFSVTVLFNQHSSWQGVITWIEQDEQVCFRSVFELLNLIDNIAVSKKKIKQIKHT